MKRMTVLIAVMLFLAGMVLTATAGIYMQFGDIKGESTNSDHTGWVDVSSVSWGVDTRVQPASGLPTGKRQHKPLSITKPIDVATPLLIAACADGKPQPQAEIRFTRAGRDGEETLYLIIKMENVLATSYSMGGGGSGDPPREEVVMTYAKITWTYVSQDGKAIEITDDWRAGK